MPCCEPFDIINKNGCITVLDDAGNTVYQGTVCASVPANGSVFVTYECGYTKRYYEECYIGDADFTLLFDKCISEDVDPEFEKIDTDYEVRCRIADEKMVTIKICTFEDGTITYTDMNASVDITESDFTTLYAIECPVKKYTCESKNYILSEGNTATYADLLSDFIANGQFDDGSSDAEEISFAQVNNSMADSMLITYNGETFTSGGLFSYGNSDSNNPIITDFSVTSVCGDTIISYTAYKCIQ